MRNVSALVSGLISGRLADMYGLEFIFIFGLIVSSMALASLLMRNFVKMTSLKKSGDSYA